MKLYLKSAFISLSLLPALLVTSCNKGKKYTKLDESNIQVKGDATDFWIRFYTCTGYVEIEEKLKWEIKYESADQSHWNLSAEPNGAASSWSEDECSFAWDIENNSKTKPNDGEKCKFYFSFEYYKDGFNQPITWSEDSSIITWTWSDPTK